MGTLLQLRCYDAKTNSVVSVLGRNSCHRLFRLNQSVFTIACARHSSWSLEDLLEPWVHYVPLNRDLSDVEEKMQWVIDHDQEAQMIAKRGALWMKDLLYHPDSQKDEQAIFDEIIRRYRDHFVEKRDLSFGSWA